MFAADFSALDTAETLARVAAAHEQQRQSELDLILLAQHYADLHPAPTKGGPPGSEQAKVYGGDGCPEIAEFAAAEFGAVTGRSSGSAARFIGQAVALPYRFPETWEQVRTGQATAWKALQLIQECITQPLEAAAIVDRRVAPIIDTVTYHQLLKIIKAASYEADPDAAKTKAANARKERGVWTGRTDDHGTTTLFIKAATGDIIQLKATINQLADALHALGDTDPIDQRRARAAGLLADPTLATDLLTAAAHYLATHPTPNPEQPTPQAPEPESEPAPPWACSTDNHTPSPTNTGQPSEPGRPSKPGRPSDPGQTSEPIARDETIPHAIHLSTPGDRPDQDRPPTTPADADPPHDQPTTNTNAPIHPTQAPQPPEVPQPPGPPEPSEPGHPSEPSGGEDPPFPRPTTGTGQSAAPTDRQPAQQQRGAPPHAHPDSETDTGPYMGSDIGPHIGPHIGPDIGSDIGSDIGPDIDPDTGSDIDKNPGTDADAGVEADARLALRRKIDAIRQNHPDTRGRRAFQTVVNIHITDETLLTGQGTARVEGYGPVYTDQLAELLGHHRIVTRPVIDLHDAISVHAYEIPQRIREHLILRYPTEQFPYGTGETTHTTDLDHIQPYNPAGRPGQTNTNNLNPLRRFTHRLKTHGGWTVRRTNNHTLEWTTPHGYTLTVDHNGTHPTTSKPPTPRPHQNPNP